MLTVAVIGHTGFVGKAVTQALIDRGIRVLGFARKALAGTAAGPPKLFRAMSCDVTKFDKVRRVLDESPWPIDVAILLAACVRIVEESPQGVRELFETNVGGVLNVLEAMKRHHGARVIFTSSMAVYGRPNVLPVSEQHPREPQSLYGLTKMQAEDMVSWFGRHYGFATTVLRLPGLYGGGRWDGTVFRFVQQAMMGEAVRINLSQPVVWDVLHVDDAVSAICAAVTGPASGHRVFNLDQGEPVELVNVAHRIVKWLGSKSPVIVEGSAESVEFQLDITQARNHLGFKPVPLAQRVLEMAAKMESRP